MTERGHAVAQLIETLRHKIDTRNISWGIEAAGAYGQQYY
jgi:hypothetical protein